MKPLLTGLYLHCVVPTSQFIHLSLSAYVFSIYFPTITLHDSVRHMLLYVVLCTFQLDAGYSCYI